VKTEEPRLAIVLAEGFYVYFLYRAVGSLKLRIGENGDEAIASDCH
jgi:hypothetical protein